MTAGGGGDADRRGRVPLVLAAAVRVHVGVAQHDGHRLGAGRAERHELGVEHLGEVRRRASGGRVRDTSRRTVPSAAGASAGGGAGRRARCPGAGSATARRVGHAVDDERDVHGPVGAAGLAALARAVERVDDPHALALEADGIVLRLLREDRVVGSALARGTARIRSLACAVALVLGARRRRGARARSSPASARGCRPRARGRPS